MWQRLMSAIPDAAVAMLFAAVWIRPQAFGPDMISALSMIMLPELLLMHSGLLLAGALMMFPSTPQDRGRVRLLAVLGVALLVYVPFALALASQFTTWWPLLTLLGAFAAKFFELLFAPTDTGQLIGRQGSLSVFAAVLWLALFFITGLLPVLPALGLSDSTVRDLTVNGFGAWEKEPERLCAHGLMYFAASAVLRVRLKVNLFAEFSHSS